jgi:hypothetical protein
MAFTKSPTQDTYSSEDIDLSREITTRAGNIANKDEDYVNVFLEKTQSKSAEDKRTFITKRAGVRELVPATANTVVRGSIFWVDQGLLVYSCNRNVYVFNFVTNVVTTLVNVFTTTSGVVGFVEYQYENGTTAIIGVDGTNLIKIDTALAVTTCVDPDLPVPHQPYPIYLDGYVFIIKSSTADIYGSDLNDPMSWDPTNFITAEMEADSLLRLEKLNNYIMAFGSETIEYFWDAGNATGSPLQRNDTPIKYITDITGIARFQNSLFFIGRQRNGDMQVFKATDFKVEPISSPTISRFLNSTSGDFSGWYSNVIAFQGHSFYCITAAGYTYIYDMDTELWTRLSYQAQQSFPIYKSLSLTNNLAFRCIFVFPDSDLWYKFDETLYQDVNVDFPCTIVTEATNFGTMYRKTMSCITMIADRPPVDANLLVQWTDDDYQSYNTGVSTNLNQDLPSVRRLGSFRQRAFKLSFSNNTLFRIQSMIADINKGNS